MAEDEEKSLEKIRQRIDQIDDAILDLLGERMQAVEAVRAAKALASTPAPTAMRPGREAQIVRRLVAARHDDLPADMIARLWREVIASATRIQRPMKLHVSETGGEGEVADLARGHFGAGVPMVRHSSRSDVIDALAGGGADVGIVAVAGGGNVDWPERLLDCAGPRPNIVAALPFVGAHGAIEALVIGHAAIEDTGDDSMVVAVKVDKSAGIDIGDGFHAAGLEATRLAGNGGCELYSVAEWLDAGDARLVEVASDPRISAIEIVGSFANPVRTAEED